MANISTAQSQYYNRPKDERFPSSLDAMIKAAETKWRIRSMMTRESVEERIHMETRHNPIAFVFALALLLIGVAMLLVGCSAVTPAPSPVPTPTPTVGTSPAPTQGPAVPTPAPTTLAVSVLVTRADGRPVQSAEITLDGTFRGVTDSAGRYDLGTLTIGQSYRIDVYQGEYAPVHASRTAAAGEPTWAYVLTSLR